MTAQRRPALDFDVLSMPDRSAHTLESAVEKFFTEEAVEYGCIQHKVIGVRSWPDRNLYWPVGAVDMVELKKPKGGRFEKGQKELHQQLRDMGHTCVVLKTKEQVKKWFRERAAMLGVPRRPPMPRSLRNGSLSALEYMATLQPPPVKPRQTK